MHLTAIAKALPSSVQALPHVVAAVVRLLTPDTLDGAAALGLLRILETFLDLEATTGAMDEAAAHGHFEVVKWLHSNRTEGCTVAAVNGAAKNGHLDILQWLCESRGLVPTEQTLLQAVKGSHLDVMKWILEHHCPARRDLLHWAPLDTAAATGNVQALDLLLTKGRDMSWIHALHLINIMVRQKHVNALVYFVFEQKLCPVQDVGEELIEFTVTNNYVAFTELLLKTKTVNVSKELFETTMKATPVNLPMVMVLAAQYDKMILYKYVRDLAGPKDREDNLLLSVLVENLSPHDVGMALLNAVIERRLDNIVFFRERASLEMRMIALEHGGGGESDLEVIKEVCKGLTTCERDDALLEAAALNLRFAMKWIRDGCSKSGRFRAQLVSECLPTLDKPEALLEKRMQSIMGYHGEVLGIDFSKD